MFANTVFNAVRNGVQKFFCKKNFTTVPSSSPSCPLKQHMEVDGKCALVVDGTSGVGHAFADELLKMNAAKVIITGLNGMKGAETACEFNKIYGQGRVDFYQTDVGNPYEIKNMFKYIKNNFEALDVFFNNAETHEGGLDDMIATNFNSKIHGIILATKNMKEGSVIVNHTSAIGLNPNSDMIAHSAASTGFLVASMAFSKNKYFKKTNIRMTTLCSELFPSTFVGGTVPPITCDCQEAQRNMEISIAKSAAYLVKHGSNNTLWLCQQMGILSIVELQKIVEYTEKYEPRIIIDDQ
ncbi:3-oxoacyl-[acyl-carrier-protein] reductase FabG-like [Aphis gossypii]|uniref:3-oxoacyl-[acyl-carrier-protein] reductase FabG-like n=1 Tax=Aphis gossypii TaxID=80765 RepID=UPI002158DF66|nr:3-oxoacyl-[acyl-carrier-protein] reductase FabG-like [Aphis gossypii]